jgi:hypothetical protein
MERTDNAFLHNVKMNLLIIPFYYTVGRTDKGKPDNNTLFECWCNRINNDSRQKLYHYCLFRMEWTDDDLHDGTPTKRPFTERPVTNFPFTKGKNVPS